MGNAPHCGIPFRQANVLQVVVKLYNVPVAFGHGRKLITIIYSIIRIVC